MQETTSLSPVRRSSVQRHYAALSALVWGALIGLAGYTALSGKGLDKGVVDPGTLHRSEVAYAALLIRVAPQTRAASIYVDDDNTPGTEQGTVQFPFRTIQAAIDAAIAADDTIKVAAGTYAETIRIQDKTVHVLGGYAGGFGSDYGSGGGGDFNNRHPASNTSHIQGDGSDATVTLINAGAGILDGLRITGGSGSREGVPWAAYGGGIYIDGGAPTIANNIIEDNDSRRGDVSSIDDTEGGGVYATDAEVTLLDNIIRNNTSGRGAGVALFGGTVVVRRNIIAQNVGLSDHGGGVEIGSPTAEITHNLIRDNEIGRGLGYGWGGGVSFFNAGSSATFSHNIITGNYAPTAGAGVFIDDGAEAVLEHELIYNNACPEIGGAGVYVDGGDGVRSRATLVHTTIADHACSDNQGGNGLLLDILSDATVTNSIFWRNGGDDVAVSQGSTLTVAYTNAEEVIAGTGNLSVDPLFANPGAGDYHLRSSGGRWDALAGSGTGAWVADPDNSPVIDAGDPASSYARESVPNGAQANMGAYGNTAQASRSPLTTAVVTDADVPQNFVLYPNYPNPFNPATMIRYAVARPTNVVVAIYNLAGQRIRTLVSGAHPAGVYEIAWDGKDAARHTVASGVYVYQIEADSFIRTRTMVLLR